MAKKVLDKAAILDAPDIEIEKVEVPEWGGSVYIKSMTGAERDAFEESMFRIKGGSREANYANLRARLLVRVICDKEGNRLFKDEDAPKLGKKNAKALDRLFSRASALSGIGTQDVEDMVKNSGTAPAGSTSG